MTIAWVFPGQGSQKLGMADELLDLPDALSRFEMASDLLGRDLLKICRGENSDEIRISDINDTRNTQPALFVIESLLVDDMKRQGRKASLVAGHSLGEIVALYAAEVFDFDTALKLLKIRSELMATAGEGAMTAIIGFDRFNLEELIKSTDDVFIANDNSESQVVLSGSSDALNFVVNNLKCKRSIPLNVSGAFHSPFMKQASEIFAKKLDEVDFKDAIFPLLSNSQPTLSLKANLLKDRLKNQMTNGVRWREIMNEMLSQNITNLVEIGPGNVLSGLAKRSLKGVTTNQISNSSDLGY